MRSRMEELTRKLQDVARKPDETVVMPILTDGANIASFLEDAPAFKQKKSAPVSPASPEYQPLEEHTDGNKSRSPPYPTLTPAALAAFTQDQSSPMRRMQRVREVLKYDDKVPYKTFLYTSVHVFLHIFTC